jgi:hypothetical protein
MFNYGTSRLNKIAYYISFTLFSIISFQIFGQPGNNLGSNTTIYNRNTLMLANSNGTWLLSQDGRIALTGLNYNTTSQKLSVTIKALRSMNKMLTSNKSAILKPNFPSDNIYSDGGVQAEVFASEELAGIFGPTGQGVLAHDPRFTDGRPFRVESIEDCNRALPGSAYLSFSPNGKY